MKVRQDEFIPLQTTLMTSSMSLMGSHFRTFESTSTITPITDGGGKEKAVNASEMIRVFVTNFTQAENQSSFQINIEKSDLLFRSKVERAFVVWGFGLLMAILNVLIICWIIIRICDWCSSGDAESGPTMCQCGTLALFRPPSRASTPQIYEMAVPNNSPEQGRSDTPQSMHLYQPYQQHGLFTNRPSYHRELTREQLSSI